MNDLVVPLTQSHEFEKACKMVSIQVSRLKSPLGTCLVQTRKLPVIGNVNLVSRGPVVRDAHDQKSFLSDIRRSVRGPLVVNASEDADKVGGLKLARGAKLALVDLKPEAEARARLHQKWRNQLKKAEKSDLVIVDQPLNTHKHGWFLEAEQRQQKQRGYKNYPAALLLAFAAANKNQARLYSALRAGKPVAAMLVLKHGRMATYQAGVTTDAGRQTCAHNLILWTLMCDLQRKGFVTLDLGRADLSKGLSRFKLGAGARAATLPGSYLFWNPLARGAKRGKRTLQPS